MATIEQQLFLGNVIFSDPTAREAMANVQRYYSFMKRQERRDQKRTQEGILTLHSQVTNEKGTGFTDVSLAAPSTATRIQELQDLSHALSWLKIRRKSGDMTKQEFNKLHRPLADTYKRLLIDHMEHCEKGGE